MKKRDNIYKKVAAIIVAAIVAIPLTGRAQLTDHGYLDVDWQFNIPINTGFADKAAGWGMSLDGGYYITDNIGVGAFFAYNTNNKYIETQTLALSNGGALTTDQQHSMFQLPFGVSARYRFVPDAIATPYVSLKLGPTYAKFYSYYNAFQSSDDSWGFYICPEIGTTIYFTSNNMVGLHIALYYNYSTNKAEVLTYKINGLNNAGFRLGLSF